MNYYNNEKRRRTDCDSSNHTGRGTKYDNRNSNNVVRPFEINQVVRHKVTGVNLIVIKYGREQIECRKPDLSAEYFYPYELEIIK